MSCCHASEGFLNLETQFEKKTNKKTDNIKLHVYLPSFQVKRIHTPKHYWFCKGIPEDMHEKTCSSLKINTKFSSNKLTENTMKSSNTTPIFKLAYMTMNIQCYAFKCYTPWYTNWFLCNNCIEYTELVLTAENIS